MKQIKTFFNKLYHQIVVYFATNRLFLSYVFLALLSTVLLRNYTIGNTFDLRPLIFDLALILFIGSLGYLIRPKKQAVYFTAILLFITTVNVINCVYYTFYFSFAQINLLSSLGQAGEVGNSITEKLKYYHFIFLLMPLIFFFINKSLKKLNYFSYIAKIEKGKKMMKLTMLIAILLAGLSIAFSTRSELSRLVKLWNREYVVERYGIIIYQMNDIVQSLTPKINTLFGYDKAARNFREYYGNKEKIITNNEFTNVFKGKNVIFVHMESVQSFALDLTINNQEITPNLNKLKEQSLYFNNFYPQIGVGTSSDTEFTVLTSLMPALSGTVFVSYTDREYVTLLDELKKQNYYTFSMHGNKATMWNRDVMHKTLGYDTFYAEEYYEIDEKIGLGLSDKSFFKQIIPILENIENSKDNYVGTVITLSNHSPFDDLDKYGDFDLTKVVNRIDKRTGKTNLIEDKYLDESKLGNYLKSLHYSDEALGEFLDLINNSSYFDNTIFVFYGDHDARLSKDDFMPLYNYNLETGEYYDYNDPNYYDYNYYKQQLNRKTPLMIWTKDNSYVEEYNYPMGMIDIMPTLANMMGFKCTYCLGNDIFTTTNNNLVVFPNGNYLTSKIYYNNNKEEYVSLNEEPINEDYILKNKIITEQVLEISNDIIVYNLLNSEVENLETYKKELE